MNRGTGDASRRPSRMLAKTTTASAIAVPRQAEAVTLFASVETSRAAHDPDDDAAKHAFPGPGSLVKIAHSQKFAVAVNS
jgi:hypothetical protein